jgi:hypothetical protein
VNTEAQSATKRRDAPTVGSYSPKAVTKRQATQGDEISSLATACKMQDPASIEGECQTPRSPVTALMNYDNKSDNIPKSSQRSEITAFKAYESEVPSAQNIFYEAASDNASNNIKVAIRVRPFNRREEEDPDHRDCISIEERGTTLVLDRGVDIKKFNFDFVGHSKIDQAAIFNHIARPIADSCLQGYNGTIFAYG